MHCRRGNRSSTLSRDNPHLWMSPVMSAPAVSAHQKITFSDSWVPAVQVTGADPGDVERSGAIEAFANPADAEARAAYIRGVTKSLPALVEYDYVHGSVLVRVSRYLTPKQAAQYESAAAALG